MKKGSCSEEALGVRNTVEGGAQISEDAASQQLHRWYAVQTRSRHEKLVSAELDSRGLTSWLPIVSRRKKWSDRFVVVDEPLFPGYMFVNIDLVDRVDVLQARGVVRMVGFNTKPEPIPDEEIDCIRIALDSTLKCDPYPRLVVGAEVTIIRGPLKGLSGVLEQRNGKHKIILSVPLIGKSMAVEVDAVDIEVL